MSQIGRSTAHAPATPPIDTEVVDLCLAFGATAQVASLPDRDGFLLRVWPTGEYGAGNLACLSAIVRFGPDLKPTIEKLDWYPPPPEASP